MYANLKKYVMLYTLADKATFEAVSMHVLDMILRKRKKMLADKVESHKLAIS